MTDMICRKSMTPCRTPGMCAPHGGCPSTESVSSAWLAQLRAEYVAFGEQNQTLKAENERLQADARQATQDVFHLVNRNAKLVGFLRELRDLEQEHPQREQIGQVLEQLISENEAAVCGDLLPAGNTRITPGGLAHVPAAELEALRADRDRLDSGRLITRERDIFGKTHTCELAGLDLRAAIDAATALDDQRQPATP